MIDPNICAIYDFETKDTVETGVILSMGIVLFDLTKQNTFEELVSQGMELFFCQKTQEEAGRTTSPDTMAWWERQGEEAQRCLNAENQLDPKKLHVYLNQLYKALSFQPDRKSTRWFSRGSFDDHFLKNFCASFEIDMPYKYWCWRDARTYLDALGIGTLNQKMDKPETMVAHNAHHDAAFDAYMLQQFYQQARGAQ
jgi:hypothetical protein